MVYQRTQWLRTAWLWCCLLCAGATWAAGPKPDVFMGFYLPTIREANAADVKVSLQVWAEEIAEDTAYHPVIRTYDSLAAMRRDVDRGELQFINANGMELAETFQASDLSVGFAKVPAAAKEGLVLLVGSASGIQSFSALQGKKVLRLSRDRLSEVYLENQCLSVAGQPCGSWLRLAEEKRDIQSVYGLFFGKADAALVSIGTWQAAKELNPQVGQRLRVLQSWQIEAMTFGFFTKASSGSMLKEMLITANQKIGTPRGKQLMDVFKTDSIHEVEVTALNPYWALLAEYKKLLLAHQKSVKPPAPTQGKRP